MATSGAKLTSKHGGEKIKELAEDTRPISVSVGINRGAGAHPNGDGVSIAEVAAFNEFGTDDIPSRPFIRSVMLENKSKYTQMLAKLTSQMLLGASVQHLRTAMGVEMVRDVKDKIQTLSSPSVTEQTLGSKIGSNPLVDSGTLLDSIDWKADK